MEDKDAVKLNEKDRYKIFRKSKIKFLVVGIFLNILIVATFLTSAPHITPASTWIVALNKVLYGAEIKPNKSLKALHAESGKLPSEDCIVCHSNMKSSKLQLHRIHLTSHLVDFECSDCHDKITLEKKSNERAVHLVNVGFCKECHSPFSGLNENSAMKPVDFDADCTLCHSGKHAFRHAKPYLSQIMSPRDCKGCHGDRVLPWTPEHTKEDWVQTHGGLALDDAKKCMSCHEYGLQFCNECHEKKPPSHKPEDQWHDKHSERSRTSDKACMTCHKKEFCEKCHLGHTPGWLDNHYRLALKEGQKMCQRCHSKAFCKRCHSALSKDIDIPQIGTEQ